MKELKFHQGDVIGKMIDQIPSEAIKVDNRPIALGSSSHAHAVTGNVTRYELGDNLYYEVVGEKAILQHTNASNLNDDTYKSEHSLPVQDHNPIELPKGCYQFWIQKAYNPYKRVMERVVD